MKQPFLSLQGAAELRKILKGEITLTLAEMKDICREAVEIEIRMRQMGVDWRGGDSQIIPKHYIEELKGDIKGVEEEAEEYSEEADKLRARIKELEEQIKTGPTEETKVSLA